MNVYDFDGTIYSGDSSVDFFLYALNKKPALLRFVPRQALGFLRYGLKQIDKTRLKEYFFCFLSGTDAEALAEAFWDKRQAGIFPWYREQQKEDDVVISASPAFLLKPICSRLGIRHLIASEVDPRSGLFLGKNCKGEEKVARWNAQWPGSVIENFYSDSLSDLPMAQIAEHAFLIQDGTVCPWHKETA